MPRLIRPETVLQPTPANIPPAVSAAGQFLSNAAQGVDAVAQVYQRERQRVDEIRLNTAETDLRSRQDALLLDPRSGILNRRGIDAQSASEDFDSDWNRAVSDIEAGLSTPEQRMAFRARSATLGEAARRQVMAHQADELDKADTQAFTTLSATTIDAVQRSGRAGDDAAATSLIREQVARTRSYADRQGWTPEATEAAVRATQSKARLAQVDALVNAGHVPAAEKVLAEYGAVLLPDDREKAQATLGEAQERATIQSAASRILSTAKTATEAYEMTKGIADLGTRQSVRKLVEAEYAAKEEAQKRDQEQVYLTNAKRVQANPGRPARAVVPPAEWVQMSDSQRSSLEGLNGPPENDDRAWFAFYSMRPEDRAKLSPAEFQTQFWSKFDEAHRTRAEGLYQDSTKDRSGGAAAGIMTDNERVRSTLVSMHLVSKPQQKDWSEEDYRTATAFEQEADTRIRALESSLGRKANATEKQEVVTSLGWDMSPVHVRGRSLARESGLPISSGSYTSTREAVQTRGLQERAYVPFAEIPAAKREQMSNALRQNGRAVTRQVLEDAYGAFIMGLRNRYETLLGYPVPEGTF